MTRPADPLVIVLTTKERKRLLTLLRHEGVDIGSPTAIKNWLLDQAGIEPEVQACR